MDLFYIRPNTFNPGYALIVVCFLLLSCDSLTGEEEIHSAAYKGDLEKVKQNIFRDPTKINIQDGMQKTPLYKAAAGGNYEIVVYLISQGAEVELGNHLNERPLAKAAKNGHTDVVELLISHGANVNSKDDFGQTPLHEAAKNGSLEIVKLLIFHGADVSTKNEKGLTPKDRALKYGHKILAEFLAEEGKRNSGDKIQF